jgi:nucleoporin SEH1
VDGDDTTAATTTNVSRASLMSASGIRAGLDQSRGNVERRGPAGQPGQIRHVMTEISRLDCHRTPVWRVGFDDDGQILGSVGDEGKLMCYRQKPDGAWAKSTEMAMVKMKMATP